MALTTPRNPKRYPLNATPSIAGIQLMSFLMSIVCVFVFLLVGTRAGVMAGAVSVAHVCIRVCVCVVGTRASVVAGAVSVAHVVAPGPTYARGPYLRLAACILGHKAAIWR